MWRESIKKGSGSIIGITFRYEMLDMSSEKVLEISHWKLGIGYYDFVTPLRLRMPVGSGRTNNSGD